MLAFLLCWGMWKDKTSIEYGMTNPLLIGKKHSRLVMDGLQQWCSVTLNWNKYS